MSVESGHDPRHDPRWESALMQAPQVLNAVDDLVNDRRAAGSDLSAAERATLYTVRRDAMQAILQTTDRRRFEAMARSKEVELKYLHQVRGIRQVIPSAIFGDGYSGYGNGCTGNKMRLLYAQDRKRAGRQSREIITPIQLLESTRFLDEELVPLRIDFENDKYRLRDTLTWNIRDNTIPLELFVENMLEDFCLPLNLAPQVVQLLQEQMEAYTAHPYPPSQLTRNSDRVAPAGAPAGPAQVSAAGPVAPVTKPLAPPTTTAPVAPVAAAPAAPVPGPAAELSGPAAPTDSAPANFAEPAVPSTAVSEDDAMDLDVAEPRAPAPAPSAPATNSADVPEAAASTASLAPAVNEIETNVQAAAPAPGAAPVPDNTPAAAPAAPLPDAPVIYDEDMRITIKLDITIGQHTLTDQFEWDMNCRDNSPEAFAEVMAAEMSLPPEFATSIAHSIREQCLAHTKMLYVVGYKFDGRPVRDAEVAEDISPPVAGNSFLRNPTLLPAFTPLLQQVPGTDLERQDQDRDSRRRRRLGRTRRGGATTHPTFQQPASLAELKEPCRVADTPVYSSLLPGGIDKNLDILRMYVCNSDDQDGSQEGLYHYTRMRQTRGIPSASLFSLDLPSKHQPRYIVKLKLPRAFRAPT